MSIIFYPLCLPMANAIWLNTYANARIVLENQTDCGAGDQPKPATGSAKLVKMTERRKKTAVYHLFPSQITPD
jgi:hypothetical protein